MGNPKPMLMPKPIPITDTTAVDTDMADTDTVTVTEDGGAREALMPHLRPKLPLKLNLGTVMVMDTDIPVMDTATTVDGTERGPLMLNPKLMLGTDATTEVTMADPTDTMVDTVDTTGDKFI